MSNSENDENIRVNIRTGTSTRVPRPRPSNINEVKSNGLANSLIDGFPLTEITIEFEERPRTSSALWESMQRAGSYQELLSLMHSANRGNNLLLPLGRLPTYDIGDFSDNALNAVIARSMRDSELQRNPSVVLDIRSHHCKTTEVDGTCSVCQSKFKLGEKLSEVRCGHNFHYDCLQEWGKYKPECPLCRARIPILER
jgi:hypothetical protein